MRLDTYLTFKGNCAEAFAFYAKVFGVEPVINQTFAEMPDDFPVEEADKPRVMHVSLPVGESMLMGSDAPSSADDEIVMGTNFSVSIQLDDRARSEALFAALAEGGEVKMPQQDMFWNAYFGIVVDRFGIRWMINCENPPAAVS